MVTRELKKLSRRELMDIIYQMKKKEQQLQEEIASLQEELEMKRMRLSTAGSIAEAAASITNVFNAAQKTADLYLREISCMKEETEQECIKMIKEANATITRILADGEKQSAALNEKYQAEYQKYQQLQTEIQLLEEQKKRGLNEEADHGKET